MTAEGNIGTEGSPGYLGRVGVEFAQEGWQRLAQCQRDVLPRAGCCSCCLRLPRYLPVNADNGDEAPGAGLTEKLPPEKYASIVTGSLKHATTTRTGLN